MQFDLLVAEGSKAIFSDLEIGFIWQLSRIFFLWIEDIRVDRILRCHGTVAIIAETSAIESIVAEFQIIAEQKLAVSSRS